MLQWLDLFVALVHSNNNLSGAQKLQYLKSALRGEPSQLLCAIPTTDANYTEAWDLLQSRYQNKKELVNAVLKRLISHPPLTQESATALRKLIDTVKMYDL